MNMTSSDAITARGGFDKQIENIRLPLAAPIRDSLEELIRAETRNVARSQVQATAAALANAGSGERLAGDRCAEHRKGLAERRGAVASMPNGSWTEGFILLLACAAFIGSEVYMNQVLPWLFSVDSDSLAGIFLSVAPAAAAIMLDRVFVEVFGITGAREGWRRLSGWVR